MPEPLSVNPLVAMGQLQEQIRTLTAERDAARQEARTYTTALSESVRELAALAPALRTLRETVHREADARLVYDAGHLRDDMMDDCTQAVLAAARALVALTRDSSEVHEHKEDDARRGKAEHPAVDLPRPPERAL